MMTRYEIRKGDTAPCKLVSVVDVDCHIFGKSTAVNFVCEGTHTYCSDIKDRLENDND